MNENIVDFTPKPSRHEVVRKAIFHLTDQLISIKDQFFRKLSPEALTTREYGEINITSAVNHLRLQIWTGVKAQDREKIIDSICNAMKKEIDPKSIELSMTTDEIIEKKKADAEKQYKAQQEKATADGIRSAKTEN